MYADLARKYKGKVDFASIYIREAHAKEEWSFGEHNGEGGRFDISQPKDTAERITACEEWIKSLGDGSDSVSYYVDGVDDAANLAYGAHPERLYIFSADGKVAYQGGPGPFGHNMAEVEAWLDYHIQQS